ncbi:metal ABC transporter ATP-binding protein [Neisseria cinerea]|uniref:metal ABC transporter ATP-binding protein n=1 Tax=Neisseria cinerea TaxID=483 RepID=UPI00288AA51C|nr:metal ABC transporter ATP-binding protein [Neisseria cinerea]
MSIIVENLTVSYHRRPAVHHVDITFEEHSMWAVFGPNGAGKSTFLKSLMGLQPLDTGSIRLDGLTRQNIAYLPQQSDIDRSQPMTVFDLAAMGLWYEIGFFKGINSTQKQRVHEALERVGMQRFAGRQIAYLSNGQFQRVLFARMLVQNAKFLLLDEPFNAVDARTTYELLDILQKCHCNGHAIIAVLHDYEQVRAYFPNTMLLAREKIAAGATETILTEAYLTQANAKMQKQESPDWCAS